MTTLRNVWHTVIGRVDFVDPLIAQFLFASPYASVLWLAARLYLGWKWLGSGIDKLGNSAWMDTGAAVQGFWARAVVVPETGRPVVTYDWYRDFLQFMLDGGGHYVWFAKLIAIGEVAIGVALVLGLFVGISAFGGRVHELELHDGGNSEHEPGDVCHQRGPDAGLEERRMDWAGPVPAAAAWHAVAAGAGVQARRA